MRSEIERVSIDYFGIENIFEKTRKHKVLKAKYFIALYLYHELFFSCEEIAGFFGIDRTTVLVMLPRYYKEFSLEYSKFVKEVTICDKAYRIGEIKKQIKELRNKLKEYEKRDNF